MVQCNLKKLQKLSVFIVAQLFLKQQFMSAIMKSMFT